MQELRKDSPAWQSPENSFGGDALSWERGADATEDSVEGAGGEWEAVGNDNCSIRCKIAKRVDWVCSLRLLDSESSFSSADSRASCAGVSESITVLMKGSEGVGCKEGELGAV